MADTTFTIDVNSIKTEVKQNLSVLGKRMTNKDGSTLFANTTLSSVEEGLLSSYIKKGIDLFLGEASPLVTGYTNGNSVVVTFHTTRVNDGRMLAFKENFSAFVSEYAQQKALELSLTEEASKNAIEDLQRHLSSAVKLVFQKDAPSVSAKSITDMTGSVTIN